VRRRSVYALTKNSFQNDASPAQGFVLKQVLRAALGGRFATCEHLFVTAEAHAHVRFRQAIERRALWAAEDAAREMPELSLEDALQLVHLYADRGSPKYEAAARRWLYRYLEENAPELENLAEVVTSLAKRVP
jgi:hypothetical protein